MKAGSNGKRPVGSSQFEYAVAYKDVFNMYPSLSSRANAIQLE